MYVHFTMRISGSSIVSKLDISSSLYDDSSTSQFSEKSRLQRQTRDGDDVPMPFFL